MPNRNLYGCNLQPNRETVPRSIETCNGSTYISGPIIGPRTRIGSKRLYNRRHTSGVNLSMMALTTAIYLTRIGARTNGSSVMLAQTVGLFETRFFVFETKRNEKPCFAILLETKRNEITHIRSLFETKRHEISFRFGNFVK